MPKKNKRTYVSLNSEATAKIGLLARIADAKFKWGKKPSSMKVMKRLLEQFSKLQLSDLQYILDHGSDCIEINKEKKE